jgi:hypothetical protein
LSQQHRRSTLGDIQQPNSSGENSPTTNSKKQKLGTPPDQQRTGVHLSFPSELDQHQHAVNECEDRGITIKLDGDDDDRKRSSDSESTAVVNVQGRRRAGDHQDHGDGTSDKVTVYSWPGSEPDNQQPQFNRGTLVRILGRKRKIPRFLTLPQYCKLSDYTLT